MKKSAILFISFIFVFGIISVSHSAEKIKIGVLNLQKILKESTAGKLANKELIQKGAVLKKKIEKEKQELEKMEKNIKKQTPVLSAEKIKKQKQEFNDRFVAFRKMQADYAKELNDLDTKIFRRMQKEVFNIAREIGKKEGYLMILERNNSGVIYLTNNMDITDQVIIKYNKKTAKTK